MEMWQRGRLRQTVNLFLTARWFESIRLHHFYSLIAQSVERRTVNPQVGGSNPPRGAKYRSVAQSG